MTTSSTSSATTNSAAGTAATAEPSTFNSNDDEAAAERIPLTAGSLVDVPSGRWHRHVEATDPVELYHAPGEGFPRRDPADGARKSEPPPVASAERTPHPRCGILFGRLAPRLVRERHGARPREMPVAVRRGRHRTGVSEFPGRRYPQAVGQGASVPGRVRSAADRGGVDAHERVRAPGRSRPTASRCTRRRWGRGRWSCSATGSRSRGTRGATSCRRSPPPATRPWPPTCGATARRAAGRRRRLHHLHLVGDVVGTIAALGEGRPWSSVTTGARRSHGSRR